MRAAAIGGPIWLGLLYLLPLLDASGAVRLVLVVAFGVPLLFGWSHMQAHVQLNGALEDPWRDRWRVALIFPLAMTVYWWRHVRGT